MTIVKCAPCILQSVVPCQEISSYLYTKHLPEKREKREDLILGYSKTKNKLVQTYHSNHNIYIYIYKYIFSNQPSFGIVSYFWFLAGR